MIKQCRSCKSKDLQGLLSLGNQYLSDFINQGDKKPNQYPLDVVLCQDCFLVQMKNTALQSELYTENYGYKSGINGMIRADLEDIVFKALAEVNLIKDDAVLEIGANDGTLIANYPTNIFRVAVEPIKKLAKECEKHADIVINDFFNYNSVNNEVHKKFKIVTMISCFYDLEYPNQLVQDVKKILTKDGIWIVQQNYVVGMLQRNAFDNIVHEHLEFYSLLSMEKLLNRHGLEVYHVEQNEINGGSFRTYICHKGARLTDKSVLALRESEKMIGLDNPKIYQEFTQRVKIIADKLHSYIEELVKDGKTVYTYGASTRGNTLLQYCDLDHKLIKAAVERNPEKWGKIYAGTEIPMISEEEARKNPCDYALILPWFFAKEIVSRDQELLNSGMKFIIPLPTPKLITNEGEKEIE